MRTYEEIGKAAGLRDNRLSLYVQYMRLRWWGKESLHCATGYARKWADRFARGVEYRASDPEGQALLSDLYRSGVPAGGDDCATCDGDGEITWVAGGYEQPEHRSITCPCCDGTGYHSEETECISDEEAMVAYERGRWERRVVR